MKLSVNLPDKAYDLLIEKGKLETVGNWVSSLWEKQKIVIITDDTVNELYGKKVEESIKNEDFELSDAGKAFGFTDTDSKVEIGNGGVARKDEDGNWFAEIT